MPVTGRDIANPSHDSSARLAMNPPGHHHRQFGSPHDDDEVIPDAPSQISPNPWDSKPRTDQFERYLGLVGFACDDDVEVTIAAKVLNMLYDEPDCPLTRILGPQPVQQWFKAHIGRVQSICDFLSQRNFTSALHEFERSQTSHTSSDPRPFEGEIWKRLFVDWTSEYRSEGLDALRELLALSEAEPPKVEIHSKCISIIQSSGTGKSRLVSELGKGVFSLSFTLRDRDSTGYPPGDFEVLEFLKKSKLDDALDVHSTVIALLSATLRYMIWWLAKQKDTAEAEVGGLARRWHDEMQPVSKEMYDSRSNARKTFCKDVVKAADLLVDDFRKDAGWAKAIQTRSYDEMEQLQIVERQFLGPAKQMIIALGRAHANNQFIVLATWVFDEAVNMDPIGGDSIRFPALRRILRVLRHLPLWCMFLSTDSAIHHFTAPRREDPSERIKSQALYRFPPFFSLPMDVAVESRMKQSAGWHQEMFRPMKDFATSEHITSFGRPLWHVYWRLPYTQIREFVQQKLLCGDKTTLYLDKNRVFALLASRLCLDPCMNQGAEAIQLAQDAVSSHLRLVTGYDETLGLISTVSPSEPVVADAAAGYLMKKTPSGGNGYVWSKAIRLMADILLSGGLVGKGLKGELYSRLLFILASDFARETAPGSSIDFAPSRPLRVTDLFGTLFGENYTAIAAYAPPIKPSIRFETEGAPAGTKFQDVFKHAYTNFTHFTFTREKLPNDPQAIQRTLHQMLRRNQALQLCEFQEFWDLLIPMYLGALDQEFEIKNVSAIMVQVKNRASKNHFESNPRAIKKLFSNGQPIIEVLLDLGVADMSFQHSYGADPIVYGIIARGHTSKTFGCLSPRDDGSLEDACTKLLSKLNRQFLTTKQEIITRRICGLQIGLEYPDPSR